MNTELLINELKTNANKLKDFFENDLLDTLGQKIEVLFIETNPEDLEGFLKKFNGFFDLRVTDSFEEAEGFLKNGAFEFCVIDSEDRRSIDFAEAQSKDNNCRFVIFADEEESVANTEEFRIIHKEELIEANETSFLERILKTS